MRELKSNTNEHYLNVYKKFEKVLGHYCGRSEIGCLELNFHEIVLFFQYGVNILIGFCIFVGVLFIFRLLQNIFIELILEKLINILKLVIILILSAAGLFNIFDIYHSFEEEIRMHLPENQIYIFTDDLNKKIRDTLDKLYKRAIYMKIMAFTLDIICILEIIIVHLYVSKKNRQDVSPLLQNNYNHDNNNNKIGLGLTVENQNLDHNSLY